MATIYDYEQLNDYGKIIMDQVSRLDEEKFNDIDSRIDFIHCCNLIEYTSPRFVITLEC